MLVGRFSPSYVSELQKVSRYSPGSLGGRSCEYPEDYQKHFIRGDKP